MLEDMIASLKFIRFSWNIDFSRPGHSRAQLCPCNTRLDTNISWYKVLFVPFHLRWIPTLYLTQKVYITTLKAEPMETQPAPLSSLQHPPEGPGGG